MHEKLRILEAKVASAKRTEVAERETAADFEAFVRNEAKGVVAYVKAAKNNSNNNNVSKKRRFAKRKRRRKCARACTYECAFALAPFSRACFICYYAAKNRLDT